jgi:hypothetical protein
MESINLVAALLGGVGAVLMYSALAGAAEGLWRRARGKGGQRLLEQIRDEEGRVDEYRLSALEGQPVLQRVLGPLVSDAARWMGAAAGTADRDALLLLQAAYPRPFNTLGDFYGWKVIAAFWFFLMGLMAAAVTGAAFFVFVAFALGVFGLYLPDLSLQQAAGRRQEAFRIELAEVMDRMGMMLGAGDGPDKAIRRIAGRGGGLFVLTMRERVVADLNSGRATLIQALHAVEQEFPLQEYQAFVDAIALGIEQGAPLVSTLGGMADQLRTDMETELLGQGLRKTSNMIIATGIGLLNIFILIGAPMAAMWMSSP